MSGNVTVNVYSNRKSCDVCGELLNVNCKCGGLTAESLRTDAEAINLLEENFLKICVEGILDRKSVV